MRSFKLTVVLCSVMVLLTPRPAHAWWEFLDYLSGPGRFYGQQFDFRVWCLGPSRDTTPIRELDNLVTIGVVQTLLVRGETKPARDAWNDVLAKMKAINRQYHLVDVQRLDGLTRRLTSLTDADFLRAGSPGPPSNAEPGSIAATGVRQPLAEGPLKDFISQLQIALDMMFKASVSLVSNGIFVSFCPAEADRTFSVEVGFASLQANSDPNYAHDYTIRLNTFTTALSYRLARRADRDVIDVGFIGGMYRFSSRGFDTFQGTILEPYVDVHAPTSWVNECGLQQLFALLTVRLGVVWFPGGFDTEKFAAVPSKVRHIPGGEGTKSATIYFNLTPLLKHRPHSSY